MLRAIAIRGGTGVLEKLLLASIVTFSLYLFANLGGGYTQQSNHQDVPGGERNIDSIFVLIANNKR